MASSGSSLAKEYEAIAEYLQFQRYPVGYAKNQKRSLRRKAIDHYKIKKSSLYYSVDGKTAWRKVIRTSQEKRRVMESCHSSPQGWQCYS